MQLTQDMWLVELQWLRVATLTMVDLQTGVMDFQTDEVAMTGGMKFVGLVIALREVSGALLTKSIQQNDAVV
jgi:hypothetical protein